LVLQEALNVIGFLPEEVSGIFELLAGILNIGNITFTAVQDPRKGFESCQLDKKESKWPFRKIVWYFLLNTFT